MEIIEYNSIMSIINFHNVHKWKKGMKFFSFQSHSVMSFLLIIFIQKNILGFLGFNTAWNLRWLSWEVTVPKYVVEGYSITDNSAASMLQVYELRKLLVSLYVKCMIYYGIRSPKFQEWLVNDMVLGALDPIAKSSKYIDVDPVFNYQIDEDYDLREGGISKQSFSSKYLSWIQYCSNQRGDPVDAEENHQLGMDNLLVAFCYGISLVGRRTLVAASHNRHSSVESFLFGLHALFKGDFRISCSRDDWVCYIQYKILNEKFSWKFSLK